MKKKYGVNFKDSAFKNKKIYNLIVREFKDSETIGDIQGLLFCVYTSIKYMKSVIFSDNSEEFDSLRLYFDYLIAGLSEDEKLQEKISEIKNNLKGKKSLLN
jgi:hypothetical protein